MFCAMAKTAPLSFASATVMPELMAFCTEFSPALVWLRYCSDSSAPELVLTLIPFIGWSPFWFVFASVLLAGRFALPNHSQRLCRRRIQNWLTFFCEARTENIVPDNCAGRCKHPVEFTDCRQYLSGAAAEFAAFDLN